MENEGRTDEYQKDQRAEQVLLEMNQRLFPLEQQLIEPFDKPELPVIFIIGAQRSGTTLLMQLLTQQFSLSYPSNFIARYWMCPYVGATLYQSFRFDGKEAMDLTSDLGFTKGIHGPHEFGYFWKRWFPWQAGEAIDYGAIDYSFLAKELAAWQHLTGQPLIFKNLIQVANHVEKLHQIFPNAFFINLERMPLYNMQSTYLSRKKLFGDTSGWFGVKPKAYPSLKERTVEEQIAGQVFFVRKEINEQLSKIPDNQKLSLTYEDLVSEPERISAMIQEKIPTLSKRNDNGVSIPSGLSNGNVDRLPSETLNKLLQFYQSFEDAELE